MLVDTGIRLALPDGHVGLIWPRSGMAVKHGIDCGAGVIDSQYRGEVKVLLFNHSDGEYFIQQGDRIAQLLIQKVETVEFQPVDDLDATAEVLARHGGLWFIDESFVVERLGGSFETPANAGSSG